MCFGSISQRAPPENPALQRAFAQKGGAAGSLAILALLILGTLFSEVENQLLCLPDTGRQLHGQSLCLKRRGWQGQPPSRYP